MIPHKVKKRDGLIHRDDQGLGDIFLLLNHSKNKLR